MTNTNSTLLVSGASGKLGRRVVELLLEDERARGRRLVATTRTPDELAALAARGVEVRAASFDDPASLDAAFRGVDRALIVSTDAVDVPGRRIAQHLRAVNAAKAAGVQHLVYTSLTNTGPSSLVTLAPDHHASEQAIIGSGLSHTLLRNNLYTDYLMYSLPHEVRAGRIVNCIAEGSIGYVTREDCARAAAAALVAPFAGRATLDITGPAAITQAELATIASDVSGRPVSYEPVSPEEMLKGLIAGGVPEPMAALLVSFQRSARAGQLAEASSALKELTGKAPESVRDFLGRNRAALVA